MEVFVVFITVLVLIGLIVSIATLCLLAIILYRTFEQDMQIFPNFSIKKITKKDDKSSDIYTPEYSDNSTSLENFTPDFNRPVKVNIQKTSTETIEDDELHPITSSDPLIDPDEPKEDIHGKA